MEQKVTERWLAYQPPYRWQRLLDFWAGRAIDGVEQVVGGVYFRTVKIKEAGWIRVEHHPEKQALSLTVPEALIPDLPLLEARVRHMFDLDADPAEIDRHLSSMNEIQEGLFHPGTRVPGSYDSFEMCVRAILGQQITVKAARTIASRLAADLGEAVDAGMEGLDRLFPSPVTIAGLEEGVADRLGPLGVTGRRSLTIQKLAELHLAESMDFFSDRDIESKMKTLLAIPGIGPWTAQYIAMRTFKWPDAFPGTDYGVKKALEPRSQKEIDKLAENWRPYRAYATVNIWNSL